MIKVRAALKPKVRVEDVQDSGTGSGTDPETSCPDTSVEGPRPEAGSEATPTPAVEREECGDVDDGVLATPGGIGDPDSTDTHPVDPAAATQLSDLLQRPVQESIPWDLTQQ